MTLTLGFHNRWTTNHLIFVKWSLFSKAFLFKAYLRLLARFKKGFEPQLHTYQKSWWAKNSYSLFEEESIPWLLFCSI